MPPHEQLYPVTGANVATSPVEFAIDTQSLAGSGADPNDVELAAGIVRAANELRQEMDVAARAGQILKPSFQQFPSKSAEYGAGADSFICKIEVYRKLI